MVAEAREGDVLRRQAARGRDRAEAALEARDALLERRDRRVRQARVDVAVLLQCEARRGIGRVVEDEGARLVDRERRAPVSASGMLPAWMARVLKPYSRSAMGPRYPSGALPAEP